MKKLISEIIQVIIFVVGFLGVALLLEGTIDIVKEIVTALIAYIISRLIAHFVIKARKNEEN